MAHQPNVNTNSNPNANLAMRVYTEMVEALTALEQQKLVQSLRNQLVLPQAIAAPPPIPNNPSSLLVADALNAIILQAQNQTNSNPLVLALAAANHQAANSSALATAIAQSLVNPAAAQATQVLLQALTGTLPSAPPSVTASAIPGSTVSLATGTFSGSPLGGPFQVVQPVLHHGLVYASSQQRSTTKRAVSDLSSNSGDDSSGSDNAKRHKTANYDRDTSFLHYHDEKWSFHFNELVAFKNEHGHCNVPYGFEENKALSRWVKRQRYQYKQKMEGRTQAMPESRIRKLDQIGFVWGAQELLWQTRFHELKDYKQKNGHCNVPYIFDPNPKLAIWVKCQRRQYKLLHEKKPSNMNADRIRLLNELGFVWTQRKPSR